MLLILAITRTFMIDTLNDMVHDTLNKISNRVLYIGFAVDLSKLNLSTLDPSMTKPTLIKKYWEVFGRKDQPSQSKYRNFSIALSK